MPEHFVKLYRKEEEFLDGFSGCAFAAAKLLGDWTPNFQASDNTRSNEAYFLKSGELSALTFDCATVHHDENQRFSSVQVALVSSTREVTIRVESRGTELIATKTLDRPRRG